MKTKTIIKLAISSIFGIIIDQAFSITNIIKQALDPLMIGPFLAPIKPFIILCFFLVEIAGIYGIINQFSWLEHALEDLE